MAIRVNNSLRSYIVDTGVVTPLGPGAALLKIYTGTQPGTGGATAGTSRIIGTVGALNWSAGTNGTAVLVVGSYTGTAGTDGTAGWARLSDGAGTSVYIIDGGCGTESTQNFVIDAAAITKGATITATAVTLIMPES